MRETLLKLFDLNELIQLLIKIRRWNEYTRLYKQLFVIKN